MTKLAQVGRVKNALLKILQARFWVQAFIVWHLGVILVWGMPPSALKSRLSVIFEPYVQQLGLWHSWDMFAPTPLYTNSHVYGIVTLKNGELRRWDIPRPQFLSLWTRYYKERYRKWRERIRVDAFQGYWHDTALFMARTVNEQMAKDEATNNPPVSIELYREWEDIAPPSRETYQPIFPPKESYPNKFMYFKLTLKEKDL